MTTYKELFGKYVQNYASDPTSTDAEGQIWYNTTSGTFKTALGGVGAWSAGTATIAAVRCENGTGKTGTTNESYYIDVITTNINESTGFTQTITIGSKTI